MAVSRHAGTATTAPTARLPVWAAPAALAAVVLLLRLPTYLEPPYYGDEGVFFATAQRWLQGEPLYAGAWDNKPPFIYALYAGVYALAGPSVVGLRALGALLAIGTTWAVLGIGRRAAGGDAALAGAALYAVLASLPMLESTLLLTESVAALPAAAGVLLALSAALDSRGSRRDRGLALAGVLFGVACCAKQVAVADAAAVGVWLLMRPGRPLRDVAALAGGWLAVLGLVALALAVDGAADDAWQAAVWGYRDYLGERSPMPGWFPLVAGAPALVAVGETVRARRRGGPGPAELALLWFAFTLAAVLLPARPFGHYLVQALAPAAVSLAVALGRRRVPGVARTTAAAFLLAGVYLIGGAFRPFWFQHDTVRPAYYANWMAYVTGERDRATYERFFDWRIANHRAIARAVRDDGGERTLYVWGEYPWTYPLSDASNATRYATSYQTFLARDAKAEVIRALESGPPRFIAEETEEWRRLPGLRELLDARYEPIARIDNTVLWRRRD